MADQVRSFGKYQVLEPLGSGGFATVYRARDATLNRQVALKLLHPQYAFEPDFARRFLHEARTVANLSHPHIITLYEVGDLDGQLFLAMELVDGGTLREKLREQGRLGLEETVHLLTGIADALDYAHSQGLVHRDVKPANILLKTSHRGDLRPILSDFGLVKALAQSSELTRSGTMVGTLEFMAPEQIDADLGVQIGPATDLYALGVVAYHMLSGQAPFGGSTANVMNGHLNKQPPPLHELRADLPAGVSAVIGRALAKAPGDRYPSAMAFVEALAAARTAPAAAAGDPALVAQTEPTAVVSPALAGPAASPEPGLAAAAAGPAISTTSVAPTTPPEAAHAAKAVSRPKKRIGYLIGGVILGVIALLIGLNLRTNAVREEGAIAVAATATANAQATANAKAMAGASASALTPTTPPDSTVTPTTPPDSTATPTQTPVATFTQTPIPSATPTPSLRDDMSQIFVPAGDFLMGSASSDSQVQSHELPQHTVYLDDFWIDRTEVTNAQYGRCVSAGACSAPHFVNDSYFNSANQPVVGVIWEDARNYCTWAGRRLPTEAEWEKAARGADGRVYPWGNEAPACVLANYLDCVGVTRDVGSSPRGASPYGALDMAGNVWEWVADWYDGSYYATSPARNPAGPSSGEFRVLRGGTWADYPDGLRSAFRFRTSPTRLSTDAGFRCARS